MVLGFGLLGSSSARADIAYIGYYHNPGAEVTQINVTGTGSAETINSTSTFATGYQPEAIVELTNYPGSHSTELLIVNVSAGTVMAYDPNGTLISSNILKGTNFATMTLNANECAGMALSSNGQAIYVADSATAALGGGIYEFSTLTGQQIGYVAMDQAHDVTFHNGYLYAAAYQSTSYEGVYQFNANLTQVGTGAFIASNSTNDLYHATGMAFIGNTLYVGNAAINSTQNASSFVGEFNATTGAYLGSLTSSTMIDNPFGLTAGPDGNLYISSLGNVPSGGSDPGQITEYNTTSHNLTQWLASNSSADGSETGQAPKYLFFASQAPSYSGALPEPSSVVLMSLGLAGASVIGWVRRRRRITAAA